jgi:hypothetical protein
MKGGYVFLGTLVLILTAIIGYMVMTKPAAQPVVVVEKEVQPTWIPWNPNFTRARITSKVLIDKFHFRPPSKKCRTYGM